MYRDISIKRVRYMCIERYMCMHKDKSINIERYMCIEGTCTCTKTYPYNILIDIYV